MSLPIVDFEVPLEVVVLGVISGMLYGLLGVGLTLLYRSARVINFAHGDAGALASAVMVVLVVRNDLPYGIGLVGALAIAVLLGAAFELLVMRRLVRAPRLVVMVATLAWAQVLLALTLFLPRADSAGATFPVPFEASVTIGSLRLATGELLILTVVPVVTVVLSVFLRRSKIGLGARAAAENLEAAQLSGVPAKRISLAVWVIAAVLSAVSAILVGPTRTIFATGNSLAAAGPVLMVRALGASILGGLNSLPQVFASGVFIGVVEVLVRWNYPTAGALELVMFAIIVAGMLLRRELGVLGRGGEQSSWSLAGASRGVEARMARLPRVRRARAAIAVAAVAAAAMIAVPMSSSRLVLLSSVCLFALIGLSSTVLTGYAGQVSLAQFTFVGLGAVVGGRLAQLGYPAWVAILYAVAGGAVVALGVGLPALRVRGLFLAVTTLAFAVAADQWIPAQRWLVINDLSASSLRIPRQEWFGVDFQSERNYYWLCLAALVVVALIVGHVRSTGLGRAWMAVRDNEAGAATFGVSPERAKLTAFVVSGAIASLGGYLYGNLLVNFAQTLSSSSVGSAGATLLGPSSSIALVTMVIFGGVTTVMGAVLGALWVRGIPYLFGTTWGILSSGAGVLAVLLVFPGGLAAGVSRVRDRLYSLVAGRQVAPPPAAAVTVRQPLEPLVPGVGPGTPRLVAEDVVVQFGGLVAVDGVTLEARHGEVVGLIGPNGAGKTTLFDVLGGRVRPSAGRVLLDGDDVTARSTAERARMGLGRTFQEARLFPDLLLVDAIKLSLERHDHSEAIPSLLALPPSRAAERRKDAEAARIIDLLGLGGFAYRTCGELSTGTRRFAELGCMVAMGCDVILLDEPTAGIAQREVEAFTPVLREIRDHLDATMVIIDHDIPMVMGLVDRVYVMAAGELVAVGDPSRIRDDPRLVASYLGTDERAIHRSGAGLIAAGGR